MGNQQGGQKEGNDLPSSSSTTPNKKDKDSSARPIANGNTTKVGTSVGSLGETVERNIAGLLPDLQNAAMSIIASTTTAAATITQTLSTSPPKVTITMPDILKPKEVSPAIFDRLPVNVVCKIFSSLSVRDLCTCAMVSNEFSTISSMDTIWATKAIDEINHETVFTQMMHESACLVTPWKKLYRKYFLQQQALEKGGRNYVRAVYDYKPRGPGEIAMRKNEVLRLLHAKEDESVWCLVEKIEQEEEGEEREKEEKEKEEEGSLESSSSAKKIRGWVPSGYLQDIPKSCMPKKMRHLEKRRSTSILSSGEQKDEENNAESEPNEKKAAATRRMVRAIHEYVAANEDEVSFKKYDLMSVLSVLDISPDGEWMEVLPNNNDKNNKISYPGVEDGLVSEDLHKYKQLWLKVSLTRKSGTGINTVVGKIPGNFVTEDVEYVTVLFDYEGCTDTELSLKKGQRVAVLERDVEKGWLFAQSLGQRGWIPENYVIEG